MPCPRCGYPCQVGTAYCPSCQLQLVPGAPRRGGTDQMPAWVRDVQAGQAPGGGMPAAEGGGFSARGLLSDDALPQWLREAGAGAGAGVGAGGAGGPPPPAYPPAYGAPPAPVGPAAPWGQPAGGQAPGYGQPVGAQQLFDESNLPEWLMQPGANGAAAPRDDAYPTVRQPSPNVSPYGSPQRPYAGAGAPPQGAFPGIEQAGAYRPAPSGGLSGNSLLDDSALPGWMRGDLAPAQGDPAAAYRDTGGMRGNSLIDDSALPSWLRNQSPGAGVVQPVPPMAPQVQPQQPAAPSIANWIGGSAANDNLPAWLDQAYNDARVPPLQAPPAAPDAGWPPPPNGTPGVAGLPPPGTLNATSLMDESALPEWLRAQGQAPAPGPASAGRSAAGAAGHAGTLADMHTARMPQPQPRPQPARPAALDPGRTPFAGEPEPQHFAASDLIDPDVLPSFLQGGNAGALGAAPPFGMPAANNSAGSRAPQPWSERDAGNAGYAPARGQPSGRGSRGAPIPQDELPSWLAQPEPPAVQRGAPSSRRRGDRYDSQRVPVPRDWNDDGYDASQWTGEYGDPEYLAPDPFRDDPGSANRRAGYDDDDDDDGRNRAGPTGGRRRERRGFFGR